MHIDPTGRRGKITEVPSHPVGKEAFFFFFLSRKERKQVWETPSQSMQVLVLAEWLI